MTDMQKFQFETSFDHDGKDTGTSAILTPADVEDAYQRGLSEGREEAKIAAIASLEARIADALGVAVTQMGSLFKAQEKAHQAAANEATQIALVIARKALPRMAAKHGLEEIEALVSDTLESVLDEPRIVVRVTDALFDPLQKRIADITAGLAFQGQVVLIADAALAAGDCRLEWADGGAERNSAQFWKDIDATLTRLLATGAVPHQAEDDSDNTDSQTEPHGDAAPAANL